MRRISYDKYLSILNKYLVFILILLLDLDQHRVFLDIGQKQERDPSLRFVFRLTSNVSKAFRVAKRYHVCKPASL